MNDSTAPKMAKEPPVIGLNTPQAVNTIVEAFSKAVLEKFAAIDASFPVEAYDHWLRCECDRLNFLFLGFGKAPDTHYIRDAHNTPENLGHLVHLARGTSGDCAKSVRDAFYTHASELLSTVTSHDMEEIEEWGWKLSAATETLAANLLGLKEDDGEYVPVLGQSA